MSHIRVLVCRQVLQAQWGLIDSALVERHRQQCYPQPVTADGHEPVSVASRFGTLTLSRQVCQQGDPSTHVLPGNAVLPPHRGIIMTRGLQEWACLLPQELPFVSVGRLLGWRTQEAQILGETTIRSLVRSHGQVIRQAEQAEVAALMGHDNLTTLDMQLVPHGQSRRRVGWAAELNAAVDAALAADQVRPPDGVSWADWERVLAARRAEGPRTAEALRHLGPELESDQVLLTVDEVLTRRPEAGHFLELRTARVVTEHGYRYFSGIGAAFLVHLRVVVLLTLGALSSLLLIADGARSLRSFFLETLTALADKTMILDWHQ
jgi:hypothetical protein